MTFMRSTLGVFFAIAAVAGLAAQAPQPPQDTPTFRSGVQLIDVDVVVTDKDGMPVRNLTRDDFEIIEDGKVQEVRTFTEIDLPVEPLDQLAARRERGVESDVVTNTTPEGRTYVLLLNGSSTSLRARHVAEQWLNEVMQPGDRVAVVNVLGSKRDSQPFTGSYRLALDGINQMIRGANPAMASNNETTVTLDTLNALREIAERLGTIPGRRKAIVWVGSPPLLHPTGLGGRFSMEGEAILGAWREAAQTAVNNNVAIYPVDPAGLTTALGVQSLIRTASSHEIAEETGAVAVGANSNEFSRGFATIVQDASAYYLLGYSPERPLTDDGKFYSIRVRVKRPDVEVRARRGYYARPPGAALAPKTPLPDPPNGVSVAVRDALRRPVPDRGLGLDVSTAPFKANEKEASVLITAHVRGMSLDYDAGRQLSVAYQVLDVDGKVATGFFKVFGFNLGDESKARATGTGLQFVERIALKPGRYELRLVAEQPGGPLGSVVATIDAGKFDEEIDLSGITLASRRANEVLLVGDKSLRSVLPDDPTALRRFRAADGLSAYAEVYTGLDDRISTARYDAINVATLTSTIVSDTGAVVARGQAKKVVGQAAGKSLREGFRTDFDLAKLTPGSYVLTLEARAGRGAKDVVTRKVPFAVE